MELYDLQSDFFLRSKQHLRGSAFWSLVPETRFPRLRRFAHLCSMFGSTYICETTFFAMKKIKSKERDRLGDKALCSLLRLATSNIPVDIAKLAKDTYPQSSY